MRPTQRELLSEGIWNAFKRGAGGVGRGLKAVGTLGSEIAKVVAPELTDPISKGIDKVKEIGGKVSDATRSLNDKATLYLRELGYFVNGPFVWKSSKLGGVQTGTTTVAELEYRDNMPAEGDKYPYPKVILQYDGKKGFKLLKHPRRDTAKDEEDLLRNPVYRRRVRRTP